MFLRRPHPEPPANSHRPTVAFQVLLLLAALALVTALPTTALAQVSRTWGGGTGTWTQSGGAVWLGGVAPVAGERAFLTESGATFTIDFLAGTTGTFGTRIGDTPDVTVGNASGTTTLRIGGNGGTAEEESLKTGNLAIVAGGAILLREGGTIGPFIANGKFFVEGGSYHQTGGAANPVLVRIGSLAAGPASTFVLDGATASFTVGANGVAVGTGTGSGSLTVNSGSFNAGSNGGFGIGTAASGTGTVNVAGGMLNSSGNDMFLRQTGTLNLSGGELLGRHSSVYGTFIQTSGSFGNAFELFVGGVANGSGSYTISSGTLTTRGLRIGSNRESGVAGGGEFNQVGGRVSLGGEGLSIGTVTATLPSLYRITGGTLGQTAGAALRIEPLGILQGTGSVALTGIFRNVGKLIADGGGIDATLNLSSLSASSFTTAVNTTDKGWYAIDGGQLTLRGLALTAGAERTVQWGQQADQALSMINASAVTLRNVVGTGSLVGSLLAIDRGDLPPLPADFTPVSVHSFSTTGVTSFDVDLVGIRWNDALLAGAEPTLLHYDGSSWIDVTSFRDFDSRVIYTDTAPALGLFAVVAVPEPATVMMLLVGGGLAVAARLARRGRSNRNPPSRSLRNQRGSRGKFPNVDQRLIRTTGSLMAAACLAVPLASVANGAFTTSWTGGTGTWSDADFNVWDNGVPAERDTIFLTQSTAGNMVVAYQATTMTGTYGNPDTWYGPLTLSNTGGGVTTLNVDTGYGLFVSRSGSAIGGDALTVTPGGLLAVGGGSVRT